LAKHKHWDFILKGHNRLVAVEKVAVVCADWQERVVVSSVFCSARELRFVGETHAHITKRVIQLRRRRRREVASVATSKNRFLEVETSSAKTAVDAPKSSQMQDLTAATNPVR
jgi:hypothetical protein